MILLLKPVIYNFNTQREIENETLRIVVDTNYNYKTLEDQIFFVFTQNYFLYLSWSVKTQLNEMKNC